MGTRNVTNLKSFSIAEQSHYYLSIFSSEQLKCSLKNRLGYLRLGVSCNLAARVNHLSRAFFAMVYGVNDLVHMALCPVSALFHREGSLGKHILNQEHALVKRLSSHVKDWKTYSLGIFKTRAPMLAYASSLGDTSEARALASGKAYRNSLVEKLEVEESSISLSTILKNSVFATERQKFEVKYSNLVKFHEHLSNQHIFDKLISLFIDRPATCPVKEKVLESLSLWQDLDLIYIEKKSRALKAIEKIMTQSSKGFLEVSIESLQGALETLCKNSLIDRSKLNDILNGSREIKGCSIHDILLNADSASLEEVAQVRELLRSQNCLLELEQSYFCKGELSADQAKSLQSLPDELSIFPIDNFTDEKTYLLKHFIPEVSYQEPYRPGLETTGLCLHRVMDRQYEINDALSDRAMALWGKISSFNMSNNSELGFSILHRPEGENARKEWQIKLNQRRFEAIGQFINEIADLVNSSNFSDLYEGLDLLEESNIESSNDEQYGLYRLVQGNFLKCFEVFQEDFFSNNPEVRNRVHKLREEKRKELDALKQFHQSVFSDSFTQSRSVVDQGVGAGFGAGAGLGGSQ